MSRLAFLLLLFGMPADGLADDLFHTTAPVTACSEPHRSSGPHCFAVTPDQRWQMLSSGGGLLLLRRTPPVPREPPLFFHRGEIVPVAPAGHAGALPSRSGDRTGWVLPALLLLLAGTTGSALARWLGSGWAARRRRRLAVGIVSNEIGIQRQRLQVKRFQLVTADDYGTVDSRKWRQEKRYFCTTRLLPLLAAAGLDDQWPLIGEEADRRIERMATSRTPGAGPADARPGPFTSDPRRFDPRMDPLDYERHCALLLSQSGWDARLTSASGDQGADVLARRGGRLLVVQCKLYRGAVGNAAVQQVSAARLHQRADFAAVVSNARFTAAARQLAHTNGVHLLHHEELRGFQPA